MISKTIEIFLIFLRLGLTSFGGPIAHLSYFHDEFVRRRKWLDEHSYADLVALCQFLPGPASSQVGIALGLSRAGIAGGVAAWLGFTLPSALLLIAFALGISNFPALLSEGWLHGLKIAAAAVVAQALWSMARKLCIGRERVALAIVAATACIILPLAATQLAVLAVAGIIGRWLLQDANIPPHTPFKINLSTRTGALFLCGFLFLLLFLPLAANLSEWHALELFDRFFRAGSLVFGGGHVVLPLLQSQVVTPGWVSKDLFMAGYGAAQAIPGPLFSFSAYLGFIAQPAPSGWLGALICLVAAFLPSVLLVYGTLPFWERIRKVESMRAAMQGINAAVVGLLLAAFINPVWSSAIFSPKDFILALIGFLSLLLWNVPSWAVVVLSSGAGWMFY